MTKIIDGTPLARSIREDASHAASALAAQGCPPKLAVVVATEDESTAWYVRSIAKPPIRPESLATSSMSVPEQAPRTFAAPSSR